MSIVLYVTIKNNFNPTFTVALPRLIGRRRLGLRARQAALRPRRRRVPRTAGARAFAPPT